MQKDWADQCSSDEEDEGPAEVVVQPVTSIEAAPSVQDSAADEMNDAAEPPPERVFTYPTAPPFSAYVGNLHYSVNKDILAESLIAMSKDILQRDVKILDSRIVMDRDDRTRSRGFGYVEVETVEQLQTLMELNKCDQAVLSGRKVQLDVSSTSRGGGGGGHRNNMPHRNSGNNHSSRSFGGSVGGGGGSSEIDGSKFRQGRFVKKDGSNTVAPKTDESEAPKERPALKLKPRSKAMDNDGSESNLSASASSIFGNAKARDEIGWQERRQSDTSQTPAVGANPNPTATSTTPTPAATVTSNQQPEQQQQPQQQAQQPPSSPTPRRESRSDSLGGRGRGSGGGRSAGGGTGRSSGGGRGGSGGRTSNGRGGGGGDSSGRGRGESRDESAGGGGGRGRGGNRGARNKPENDGKRGEKAAATTTASPTPTPTAPVVPPAKPAEPEKKPAKANNAFAALALDDSDSD